MTETLSAEGGSYRYRKNAQRARRTAARLIREEERKFCACSHTKREHRFGTKCDMPRCTCKAFEAA